MTRQEILDLLNSKEADRAVEVVASRYKDSELAQFAANDFRDWITARIIVNDTVNLMMEGQ